MGGFYLEVEVSVDFRSRIGDGSRGEGSVAFSVSPFVLFFIMRE